MGSWLHGVLSHCEQRCGLACRILQHDDCGETASNISIDMQMGTCEIHTFSQRYTKDRLRLCYVQ